MAFEDADFKRLVEVLSKLRGRFVMSMNDCAEIRKMFSAFRQRRVQLTYTSMNSRLAAGARAATRTELLIDNLESRS